MRRLREFFARLRCGLRGHQYDTPVFMTDCFYFCSCCGREMFNRRFEDLRPLSDEQRQMLDQIFMEERP
jgi:hypothetical protein